LAFGLAVDEDVKVSQASAVAAFVAEPPASATTSEAEAVPVILNEPSSKLIS